MSDQIPSPQPLVSVLLPTYNAGTYLRPALYSVLAQSYNNLEIIIVDDGSTDDSLNTIKDVKDNRLVIIHQENRGKCAALNKALDLMKGEYWIVQDADDLSYPDRVIRLLEVLLEKQDIAAVYSGHDLLINGKRFAPTFSPLTVSQCNDLNVSLRMPAHDPTGMYRTAFVTKLRWDEELRIGEGLDFILRVGELFSICRVNLCLYSYRINSQSITRKAPHDNIDWINKVIRKTCLRRNLSFAQYRMKESTIKSNRSNSSLNHIVSHCMESVVDLKFAGLWLLAIQTGLTCLKIAPGSPSFYKPLIYSFLPCFLIRQYRKRKKKL